MTEIIAHMKLPLLCMICILLGSHTTVHAQTMVSDSAGYLSTEEASQIENACNTILQQYDTSVFIITTDKLGKSDDYKKYLDKQAEKIDTGENLIILFISTKKNDRICHITCHGKTTEVLTDNRIKKLTAAVQDRTDSGNYYQAIDHFCEDINKYLAIKPSLDAVIFQSVPQLIFCMLLGCGIVYYFLHAKKEETATLYTYLDRKHLDDLGHLDHFSHKEVQILRTKQKSGDKDEE